MMRIRPLLLVLTAPTISSHALAQAFLMGTNEQGKVVVNDTLFNNLPSEFDPSDPNPALQERWYHQARSGHNYAQLRRDGLVYLNGARADFDNPTANDNWFRIALSSPAVEGTLPDVYCLEFLGKITLNGDETIDLPHDTSDPNSPLIYQDFFYYQGDVYSLRRDGKIFMGGTEIVDLPGSSGNPTAPERYMAIAVDAATSKLYALRLDGNVYEIEEADPLPWDFTQVIDLPGGSGDQEYVDIEVGEQDEWWALREDGSIYNASSGFALVVDFPGDGNSEQDDFRSLSVVGTDFYTIRWDGRVYGGTQSTDPICDFEGSRYRVLDASPLAPVAENVKEAKTVVSTYKTVCYPNDTVMFPILATDVDDEMLTYNVVEMPAGASFDTVSQIFSWTPTAEGKFDFVIEIGDDQKTKGYKYSIQVKAPDTDPEKNKKAKFQKLKKVQALIGIEVKIPLLAYDPDGDPLTYNVSDMPEGMTFDEKTSTLCWTPDICFDQKVKVTIEASDGVNKPVKGTVQIEVQTPFFF